jgi:hypothetical protein
MMSSYSWETFYLDYDSYPYDNDWSWVPIKVIGKIGRFIHNTQSIRKLLPLGHRWRGDVEVIDL